MKAEDVLKASGSIAIALAAGVIGSLFTAPAIPNWYAGLTKPPLNPPSWVFAPVWTTLYVLMGIAAFLVLKKGWGRPEVRAASAVYFLQLTLNALWSILFFGWHSPGAALIDIVALWLSIIAAVVLFAGVSKPAAWLFAPYLLWVSFAAYLNYAVWTLN